MAENAPGRIEALVDLIGMNDVGPEGERKTDRRRQQQQRGQGVNS